MPAASSAPAIVDDGACFARGPASIGGLGLVFTRAAAGTAEATVSLDARYQGYRGIAHGGIVMLLLDEAMAHAAGGAGEKVMTAAVAVRFRAPVPLATSLRLTGTLVSQRGKIVKLQATLRDTAGTTLATAEGSFVSLGRLAPGDPMSDAAR